MTPGRPVSEQDLMRYLDGELPPEERARIDHALEESGELRAQLEMFHSLRAGLHDLPLAPPSAHASVWDGVAAKLTGRGSRAFVAAGVAGWLAYGGWMWASDAPDRWERMGVAGVAIGILVLFALVIRDRFHGWSEDG